MNNKKESLASNGPAPGAVTFEGLPSHKESHDITPTLNTPLHHKDSKEDLEDSSPVLFAVRLGTPKH